MHIFHVEEMNNFSNLNADLYSRLAINCLKYVYSHILKIQLISFLSVLSATFID